MSEQNQTSQTNQNFYKHQDNPRNTRNGNVLNQNINRKIKLLQTWISKDENNYS